MSRFLTISYTLLNTFSFSSSLRIFPMAIRRPDSLPGTINPQDILKYVNCISCKDIKENSKILLCGHTICVACLGDAANSKNNYTCSSCQTVTSFPYKTAVKLQTNFLAKPCKEYLARCETRGSNDLASPMEIALKAKSPHVLLIKSHKYVECCRDVIKQTEAVHTQLNILQQDVINHIAQTISLSREERDAKTTTIKREFSQHLKTLRSPQQTARNTITRILQISKLLQIGKELKIDNKIFTPEETELKEKLRHAFNQVDNLRASLSSIRNFYQITFRSPQDIADAISLGEPFNLLGTEVRVCQRIGGPEYLSNPVAVGVCNSLERVYILDWDKLEVVVFTWTGDYVTKFGRKGEEDGEFIIPHNICVMRNSDIVLITDWYKNNIQVFTKQGDFRHKFGKYGREIGQFDAPSGLAMCHEEQNLFISDYLNNRVQVYTMGEVGSFHFLKVIGAGILRGPMDVGTHKGKLFVLNDKDPCLYIFDYSGTHLYEFCSRNPQHLTSVIFPWYMAIDSKSNILLSDRDGHKVCIFDKQGELQQSFRTKDARDFKFKDPAGIAVSNHGKIYICDCYNSCLQAY